MRKISIALILVSLFVLSACFNKTDDITKLKEGVISNQTSLPVGQAFDKKFENPSWKLKRTFNGNFLEFKGVITKELHESLLNSADFKGRSSEFSKVGDEVKAEFEIGDSEKSLKLIYLRSKSWAGINPEPLIKVIYM